MVSAAAPRPASQIPAARGGLLSAPRGETLALLAICALGTTLRLATLNLQSFDFDESFTVGVVLNGSLSHVLHTIPLTESSPPLYYLLAWMWSRAFGLGEVGIRSLSAIFGSAVVLVAYPIGRRCGSPRGGLLAALLIAVNPLMVWYSQEARVYALLALLSALSLWAMLAAAQRPGRGSLIAWALVASAALLSHYFAAFLVIPEAVWLIWVTRRRVVALTAIVPLVVGVALVPLAVRQSDHRTEWIESLTLLQRIREVVKKWATGEIAPVSTWQLGLVLVLVGLGCLVAVRRSGRSAGRGGRVVVGIGAGAVLVPLLVDLAGLHYLISKNVMPALTVLLIALGLILGGRQSGRAAGAAALLAVLFFLGLTLAGSLDPAMQRPDIRGAAAALGPPGRDQVVVTQRLGDQPLKVYRPGAVPLGARGLDQQLVVVRPLPRADVAQTRGPTPAPPAGFVLQGRRDARTFTLICYLAPRPVQTPRAVAQSLAGAREATAQAWPDAVRALPAIPDPCRQG